MKKIWKGLTGWQDSVELIVAAWIFVSPVVLGFFTSGTPVLVAMAVGAIVALSAQLGIAKQSPKIEMFTLGIAVLFMVSPWLFAYSAIAVATLNAVVSGGVLFTFALLSMRHEYSEMRNIHT